MLGQTTLVGTNQNPSANRIFVYEVTGLRQNKENDQNYYPVRNSGSVFIKVPYQRMNEEMRRITRLGGTIVNIQPLTVEV